LGFAPQGKKIKCNNKSINKGVRLRYGTLKVVRRLKLLSNSEMCHANDK